MSAKLLTSVAVVSLCIWTTSPHVVAQKYGIVGHSCLSSVSISCGDPTDDHLKVRLTYAQQGPTKAIPHAQMYLLAFVEKDEAEISTYIRTQELIAGDGKDKLLEILKQRRLAVILDSKVAKCVEVDEPKVVEDAPFSPASLYRFEFDFDHRSLLEIASKSLKNFSSPRITNEGNVQWNKYGDRLKFLALVPMNSKRYADKIPEASRDFDMAHYSEFNVLFKLIKILPYSFEFDDLTFTERDGSKKKVLHFYVN